MFKPLDIVYKPAEKIDKVLNCYFSSFIRQAYCVKRDRGMELTTANQCLVCNKFFIQSKSLENHMKICNSVPSIVCKLENKHILTFGDNVKCGKNPINLMKNRISILPQTHL